MLFYVVLPLIFIKVNNMRRSILLFVGIYLLSKGNQAVVGLNYWREYHDVD